MPKYSRTRSASRRTTAPAVEQTHSPTTTTNTRNGRTGTTTAATGSRTSNRRNNKVVTAAAATAAAAAIEERRHRYHERQERRLILHDEANLVQRQELQRIMFTQTRIVEEYAFTEQQAHEVDNAYRGIHDDDDNNDTTTVNTYDYDARQTRWNYIEETSAQLIANIHRVRQLAQDAYYERRLYWNQCLRRLQEQKDDCLRCNEGQGRSMNDRSTRMILRKVVELKRDMDDKLELLAIKYRSADENFVSLQSNLQQLMDEFRESERALAVKSLFLHPLPPSLLLASKKKYHSSTGRVVDKSSLSSSSSNNCGTVRNESGRNNVKSLVSTKYPIDDLSNDDPSSIKDLFVHFGNDNDTTMIPIQEQNNTCVICLLEYQVNDIIVRNAIINGATTATTTITTQQQQQHRSSSSSSSRCCCYDMFHKTCIMAWMDSCRKAECPCCRQPFVIIE